MNSIYKVIWSFSKGTYIVTSEFTKSKGKTKSKKTALALASVLTAAIPAVSPMLGGGLAVGAGALLISQNVEAAAQTNNSAKGIAIGSSYSGKSYPASAEGGDAWGIAIGGQATSTGVDGAIALGSKSSAHNAQAIAMGFETHVTGNQSVALGANVKIAGEGTVGIGGDDLAGFAKTEADKYYTELSGMDGPSKLKYNSRGYGTYDSKTRKITTNVSSGHGAVFVGAMSYASANGSTALGAYSDSKSDLSTAIGFGAIADKSGSVALGAASITDKNAAQVSNYDIHNHTYSFAGKTHDSGSIVSVGRAGKERQIINLAPGNISANSTDAVNGSQLYALTQAIEKISYLSVNSTAGGNTSNRYNDGAKALKSIAIGPYAKTNAEGAIALGFNASAAANANGSVAIGQGSKTSALNAIALGFQASASVEGGIALGNGSKAETAKTAGYDPVTKMNSVNTSGVWKSTTGTVSVGDGANITRQISGVAAGSADTDAVNIAQLKSLSTQVDKALAKETDISAENTNIKVKENGTNASGGKKFQLGLANNLNLTDTGSLTIGTTLLNQTGLSLGAGNPSITTTGINAGNKKITALANGTDANDGVNFSQLNATNTNVTNLGNNLTNLNTKVDGLGTNVSNLSDNLKNLNGNVENLNTTISNLGNTYAKKDFSNLDNGAKEFITSLVSAEGSNGIQVTTTTDANKNKKFQIGLDNATKTALDNAGKGLHSFTLGADSAGTAAGINISKDNARLDIVGINEVKTSVDGNKINVDLAQTAKDKINNAADKNLSNLSDAGKTQVKDLTKDAVKVVGNNGLEVKTKDDNGNRTYTLSLDNATQNQLKKEETVLKGDNIEVTEGVNNSSGKSFTVALAKNINLTAAGSVTLGNSVLNATGLYLGNNMPSITTSGINAANKTISNLAAGTQDSDAVNLSQLKATNSNLTNLGNKVDGINTTLNNLSSTKANKDLSDINDAGKAVISGLVAATGTDEIKVTTNTDNSTKVKTFEIGLSDSAKAALNKANSSLQSFILGADAEAKAAGINLSKESNRVDIVGVNDITTSVNGSKIHIELAQNTKTKLENAATKDLDNLSDNGKNQIKNLSKDAIKVANGTGLALNTSNAANGSLTYTLGLDDKTQAQLKKEESVIKGSNIEVTEGTNDSGAKSFTVALAKQVNLTSDGSLTIGNTLLNSSGLSLGNGKPSITLSGIDAGDMKITNLTAGTADKDAVNFAQLNATNSNLSNLSNKVDNLDTGIKNLGSKADKNLSNIDDAGKGVITGLISATGSNGIEVTTSTDNATKSKNFSISLDNATKASLAKADAGMNFSGDSGQFNQALNSTLNVSGGITDKAKLTDNNLGVIAENGKLAIKLAKDIKLGENGSLSAAQTTIGPNGISTDKVAVNGGATIDKSGIDMAKGKISNVSAATDDNDVVNYKQLKEATASGGTALQNFTVGADAAAGNGGINISKNNTRFDIIGKNANENIVTAVEGNKISLDLSDKTKARLATLENNAAASPISYVDDKGNPVVKIGDSFYPAGTTLDKEGKPVSIAKDGTSNAAEALSKDQADKVALKAGDTSPRQITNVANGIDGKFATMATPAITAEKARELVANTQGLLSKSGTDLNKAVTVADLQAVAQAGLDFTGDSGTKVHRALGNALNIKGGITDANMLTDNNIGVIANGSDGLQLKLAKNIQLGADGSLKAANTTINQDGINTNQLKITDGPSLSNQGIDMANGKISNVAAGTEDNDVVNYKQLKDVASTAGSALKELTISTDNQDKIKLDKNNATLSVTGGAKGELTDNNIGVKVSNNGLSVKLAKDLDLGANGSLKAGNTMVDKDGVSVGTTKLNQEGLSVGNSTLGSDGLKISGGPSVTKQGIDAGNKVIGNIAEGVKELDAVNKGQLDKAIATVKSDTAGKLDKVESKITDLNTKVDQGINFGGDKPGESINKKMGETLDIVGGADPTKLSEKNIGVVAKDGKLQVKLAQNIDLGDKGTLRAGNSQIGSQGIEVKDAKGDRFVMDSDGFSFRNANNEVVKAPSLKKNGIDAAGTKITQLAAGEISATSQDAVNGSQLHGIIDKGMSFGGDNKVAISQKLGGQLNIVGGADVNNLSRNNIGVVAENGQLNVRLAKNIDLSPTGSLTTGNVSLSAAGLNNGGQRLTNIGAGSADSDAANMGQLRSVQRQIHQTGDSINRLGRDIAHTRSESRTIGALSASLAALHPLQFDKDRPNQAMVGVGFYKEKYALAVGLAHHFNEDVMMTAGVSLGDGRKGKSQAMANLGLSFRFGEDRNKKSPVIDVNNSVNKGYSNAATIQVMQNRINQLSKENQVQKAKMDAMEKRLQRLEKLVGNLAAQK
ncbi:trimeric autotransporter adhesin [Mesocricetibacter intestinalis]|uniref:Trimeric autotransporter adhesin n=1 Tax=Mesocricetibacter intestinalis TaxID=1521930 RepID=A0A4R6VK70_9PAST|nr:ESPR-type extended signal peptide-containing protein [Mesocricetibacter intestinalis]TDQ58949.1 trimeric autotransporter adhesin [Mesocricetibacter intestinalis]